ncbi:hypothetical protein PHJA_000357800 [Phtheirospermum japonicum]|uniref:Uncharacterized protein n=1 Tax=Phtheirospermum japonicum TaxID=374723 RepID=A0A830BDW4_9LAMI|nr:hypothetical protein PHJA_000357800 [Phtheirospermum japonicum]
MESLSKYNHQFNGYGIVNRQSLLDHITVQLAPRAADELFYGEDQDIDSEALVILNICYERLKSILQKNKKLMDVVVGKLVEKKSLTKQEFFNLVELHGSVEAPPPNILDIRLAKCLQLQNLMTHNVEATLQ